MPQLQAGFSGCVFELVSYSYYSDLSRHISRLAFASVFLLSLLTLSSGFKEVQHYVPAFLFQNPFNNFDTMIEVLLTRFALIA